MNIIFVTGTLSGGGAERVLSLISTNLANKGYSVSIISLVQGEGKYFYSHHIKLFKYNEIAEGHLKNLLLKAKYIREIAVREQADVIIAFMTGASIVAILGTMFSKIPVIACERNNPRTVPSDQSSRILRKLLFPLAEGFVFQTEDAKNFFPKRIRNKGIIIPNPLNPALPEHFNQARRKRIVSVGRLENAKNYTMAIKAFAKFHNTHKDYVYDIYGKGSREEELRKLVFELGLQESVNFKGFSTSIYEEILDAQMFVLSSDFEGMPNALMEAMALGIPSISTDHPIGGARAIIENGKNGILVPVGDIDDLAAKMLLVADNYDFAKKLSVNAAQIRESLSIEKIANLWEDYLNSVVRG